MHLACIHHKSLSVVRKIITTDANTISAKYVQDQLPLHYAVCHSPLLSQEIISTLVQAGRHTVSTMG